MQSYTVSGISLVALLRTWRSTCQIKASSVKGSSTLRLSIKLMADLWKRLSVTVPQLTKLKSYLAVSPAVLVMQQKPKGCIQDIINRADELYDQDKLQSVYEYLNKFAQNTENPEILWRYGRACYYVAHYLADSEETKLKLFEEGKIIAQKAVELNEQHPQCLLWLGRLLGCHLELCPLQYGAFNKIATIRNHFKKSTDLDPSNAEAWYSLGKWFMNVSVLPTYQKKTLNWFTGATGSLEEALQYLLKANEVSSSPQCYYWASIAECYIHMGKKEEAKTWLQRVVKFVPHSTSDEDTKQAKEAAAILLSKEL